MATGLPLTMAVAVLAALLPVQGWAQRAAVVAPPAVAPPAADSAWDQANAPILPDAELTPGATLPVTADDICAPGYSRKVRDVPAEVKRGVYASYSVATHVPGEYEVDHLISLELGGSNAVRNLWPESYLTSPWNAHVKDALENRLHRAVCDGVLDLAIAQHDIAKDWIVAYKKYFHRNLPLPRRTH
jgi:hypothetical protein